MNRMRGLTIGIDASRSATERPTGTERYSTEVVRNMLEIGERHSWRLYRRNTAEFEDSLCVGRPNVEFVVMSAPRFWTHTRLAWEILRRPPDVLFIPAHVMPWRVSVPTVVTVHDLGHAAFPSTHTLTQRLYLEMTTRHHVSRAAHLIADSASTAEDLERRYGADPARVSVVHLGVDPHFSPAKSSEIEGIRHKLDLPEGSDYILHVGTLQPRKNLLRLLGAFARIATDYPKISLVLAGGPGWGAEDYVGHARLLGIESRVLFPGYVAEADLAALYSGALIVVVPSLYEGFGLPVLEAMACGAPVATGRGSSILEVAGDAALFFDPLQVESIAATLREAIESPSERSRLARIGVERAASFTWRRCARQTLDILEQIGGSGYRSRRAS